MELTKWKFSRLRKQITSEVSIFSKCHLFLCYLVSASALLLCKNLWHKFAFMKHWSLVYCYFFSFHTKFKGYFGTI